MFSVENNAITGSVPARKVDNYMFSGKFVIMTAVAFLLFFLAQGMAQADCIKLKYNKTGGVRVKVIFQVFNDGDDIMLIARATTIDYLRSGESKDLRACAGTMKGNWRYKALIKLDAVSSSWTAGRVVGNLPINSTVVCNESANQFECHRQ